MLQLLAGTHAYSTAYDAYTTFDLHLFTKMNAQSSIYHLTRFILVIFTNEISLKDSLAPKIKNYIQGPNSFLGLGYAIKALEQLEK